MPLSQSQYNIAEIVIENVCNVTEKSLIFFHPNLWPPFTAYKVLKDPGDFDIY